MRTVPMGKTPLTEETALLHVGRAGGGDCQTVNPPVQRGSTVLVDSLTTLLDHSKRCYGRQGLTTQDSLKDALCYLEHGEAAFLYPSGLAAITGTLMALLDHGDEVLVADCVYNPTRAFVTGALKRFGITARFFSPTATAEELKSLIGPTTRLIVLEAPGSLTFDMMDIPAVAAMARAMGVMTMIDNSWSAGVTFKPLDHGVDVSIQALTKYAGGHSDVFMGCAVARGAAVARLRSSYIETGWSVSPDDAYQILRGLRTLPTRLARHGENALIVAKWLAEQPVVQRVLCPALPSDPGHSLWQRDFTGHCGLFGVVLQPASEAQIETLLKNLHLFGLGYSWGGFESLAIYSTPQLESRAQPEDFGGPLIRLHIGLEDPDDLIADLKTALERAYASKAAVAAE